MKVKKPLTLDFKTFIESTRLDYVKDAYVSYPSPEIVKAELAKIVENPILLDRTPVLKTAFPGTTTNPKESGGNVQPADKGLPFMVSDEGAAKTTSFLEGPRKDKDSEGLKPPIDMEPQTIHIADLSGTGAEYQESDKKEVFAARYDMEEDTQADEEEHRSPSPNKDKPEPSHTS
nr:hypothetical protein [Tanacetum cinerariifolium]